ncbi:MAG: helix-turn-helix transcriptional regulator [Chloroflexi bacterium]|nr:helix-turn-helix transcriptional regulator [Chloroflexota bacterium]
MSSDQAPAGATGSEERETMDRERTHEYQDLPIGATLRKLRGSLSLRDVEGFTGISNPYLSNLESGTKKPGHKVLLKLAMFYGVDVDYLLELAGLQAPRAPDPGPVETADIERSYRCLLDDPRLRSCPRPHPDLPVDAKRFMVQAYERLTGKALL